MIADIQPEGLIQWERRNRLYLGRSEFGVRSQGTSGRCNHYRLGANRGSRPVLEKLRSLRVTPPILESPLAEGSLSDILVKKPPSSAAQGTIDPKVLVELFSLYHAWHEDKVQKITKKQEEVENRVELADALAVKLLQRFNYSVSAMKTTSQHLSEVHKLQVELGEFKGRLTEVISNCEGICKRITSEGPESLRESAAPLAAVACFGRVNNHELFPKGPLDDTGTE